MKEDYLCPKCGGARKVVYDYDARKEKLECEPCQQKVNEMFRKVFGEVTDRHMRNINAHRGISDSKTSN
jgi:hypothetical protein